MGKKSRRKKGGEKSRKEQLQDRKERVVDYGQKNQEDENDRGHREKQVYVGDRVWFSHHDKDVGEWSRGVVKTVGNTDYYVVLPVEAEDREDLYLQVSSDWVEKDPLDWTLRFQVGDKVICYANDRWNPATVTQLFPYEEKRFDCIPCYRSLTDDVHDDDDDDMGYLVALEDTDCCIMKRPTVFRFSKGDTVIFASNQAAGLANKTWEPWIRGTITRVDIVGLRDYCAVYECSFMDHNRQKRCYILKDDDQHVASPDANPRRRLLEAIEEDCDYEHLDYLVKSFNMDVLVIKDLLVSRAIESGSYDMLLWLQENASLDLRKIHDGHRNGFLHQIARSPHAERFFWKAGFVYPYKSMDERCIDLLDDDFRERDGEECFLLQTNNQGRIWLHELVISGNSRALDLALSPKGNIAWKLSRRLKWKLCEKGWLISDICDTARLLGRYEIEKIIGEFAEWHLLHELCETMSFDGMNARPFTVPGAKVLTKFGGETASSVARRLIRFHGVWGDSRFGDVRAIDSVINFLSMRGHFPALSWLIDTDPTLLNVPPHRMRQEVVNRNEFAQPELYDPEIPVESEDLNLVSLAVYGLPSSGSNACFGSEHRHVYARLLNDLAEDKEQRLIPFIKRYYKRDYLFSRLLEYKLSLLQDDDSLKNRLKVLDYLVNVKGQAPPNVLDIIRWRQCGVLRWLVEGNFVDLQSAAYIDSDLVKRGMNMEFLGGGNIPPAMAMGVFLCLAAIEFDDLQSFLWLIDVKEVPLTAIRFDGFNVIHCCAFFGRSEIFFWLCRESKTRVKMMIKPLLKEKCSRKPWDGQYAAHVAVAKGFTFLAGVLLSSGSPSQDTEGNCVYYHAKCSKLEFVREWGKVHEKPMRLEDDINQLLQLLSSESCTIDDIKKLVTSSKCLDRKTWIECNYDSVNEPGPLGNTYLGVLAACCRIADPNYVVWLYRELSPPSVHDFSNEWELFWGCPSYMLMENDVNILDVAALQVFAAESADHVLGHFLDQSWNKNLKCVKPLKANPLLGELFRIFRANVPVMKSLRLVRDNLLRLDVLDKAMDATMHEIRLMFARGAGTKEMSDIIDSAIAIAGERAREDDRELASYFNIWDVISSDGKINLEGYVQCDDRSKHPLRKTVNWYNTKNVELSQLYVVLALEGYYELISWSLGRRRSTWDAKKETAVVRISAFLGRTNVVDIFLRDRDNGESFFSAKDGRYHAAILGAAEAGSVGDMAMYLDECKNLGLPFDPIVTDLDGIALKIFENDDGRDKLASSLVGSVVFACLNCPGLPTAEGQINNAHRSVLEWIISNSVADVGSMIQAVALILPVLYEMYSYERCIDLIVFLTDDLYRDILSCQEDINQISEQFCQYVAIFEAPNKTTDLMRFKALFEGWLKLISYLGFDIQSLKLESCYDTERRDLFAKALALCQSEQRHTWSQFNLITKGRSFEEIKCAIQTGDTRLTVRYENGLLFTHVAAAYDRLDVLQWLVEEKGMSLNSCDARGRTVAEVAEASSASSTIEWISREEARKTISTFASSHFRRRHTLKRWMSLLRCVRKIQALQRGNTVRRVYRGRLSSRLKERLHFKAIWDRSISLLTSTISLNADCSWAAIKQREHDIMRAEDVDDMDLLSETTQKLGEAAASVLTTKTQSAENMGDVDPEEDCVDAEQNSECTEEQTSNQVTHLIRIKFTSDVVKWLRRGDSKYREFFVRRIEQLAAGQRSRVLNKRLTGCKTTIYETYLEQKSGYRILWTEGEDQSLLIWYVAKHKCVSRLIRLIDDAESRSSRQLVSTAVLSEAGEAMGGSIDEGENAEAERILLDPHGDTPLKLYEVHPDELETLNDPAWKPRLYLTAREREVVEASGTVLLLGRSGTGKTCVICNRMDFDRQRAGNDPGFSQLFVARSQGLCEYVRRAVGMSSAGEDNESSKGMRFETYGRMIGSLESHLSVSDNAVDIFFNSRKMDFRRFKREVYRSESSGGLDALIIWTNIRSFIKGSVEALQRPDGVLTEEEYLGLGTRRCRLSSEQRQGVYAMFERYDKYMKATGLWDDCDRIAALAHRLEYARVSDPNAYQEVRYNKLYVDEVQDYTQAEIVLFFYLCGPGDLFLAGDPAQSVVEGVEFRFEEIRSVGYHLFGEKRRHLIPDKPKTVHLNFRSHCGILNVAAAVLSCLFEVFPDSAKQLKEDRGLFHGPRPGVLNKVEVARLQELVTRREGIVVLTHDRDVPRWKRCLNYPLVYGIREAKGLEFQEVMLVDFFAGLPDSLQKPWRNLLLGRDLADISRHPEVEGHLKLLYTAITRCIQRLFFAETSSSLAGDAFVRWLTTTKKASDSDARKEALAVKNSVFNVEKMLRTPDEWRSAGLDNAVMAESSEDLSKSESWLEKAIYCFDQVGDAALASKARTHRLSIRFRLNLDSIVGSDEKTVDVAQTELDAALLMEQLLAEQLLLEAREVCCSIFPWLSVNSQHMLQEGLISRFPTVDDVE